MRLAAGAEEGGLGHREWLVSVCDRAGDAVQFQQAGHHFRMQLQCSIGIPSQTWTLSCGDTIPRHYKFYRLRAKMEKISSQRKCPKKE